MSCRRRRRGVVVAAALAAGGILGLPGAARPAPEPVVAAVEVRAPALPGPPLDLATLIEIAVGEPWDEEAVRRTVESLDATGLFAAVEVYRSRRDDGLVATVVLRPRTWVDAVVVRAAPGVDRRGLRRLSPQRAGAPLSQPALAEGVRAMRQELVAAGYRTATVRTTTEPLLGDDRVTVVYEVDAGERARLDEVVLAGDLEPFAPAELLAVLRLRSGRPYDRARIDEAAARLRRHLASAGHLLARVGGPEERHSPDGIVDLTFTVDAGPAVEVRATGDDGLADDAARRVVAALVERGYDEALLGELCRAEEARLEARRHPYARVECRVEGGGESTATLHVEVEAGPRLTLRELRFSGNEGISDEVLRELMVTAPRGTLSGGTLVEEEVEADLANLRSYYLLQGYPDVAVGPIVLERQGDDGLLALVPIVEGRRERLVDLQLELGGVLDAATITPAVAAALPLRAGGPFHPTLVDESVDVVRALLEEAGYPSAAVIPELDRDATSGLVALRLRVVPGRRQVVDRVVVRGVRRTEPHLVRQFSGLEPGEPLSRRRLLESERELYRLGIFSRVEVTPAATSDPDGGRDVVVRVEEAQRWRLAYGFSYHSEDGPGGLLTVTRSNLRGRAERAQLDLRINERDARFRLLYDKPTLGRFHLPLTYSIFRQREEREAFTVDDAGTQIALTRDLRRLRLGLVYDYRLVELSEQVVPEAAIDPQDRDLQISSLMPHLFLDRRDDPVEPRRGSTTALQLEHAFPFLSAEASFLKLFWQQTQYLDLDRAGVVAASLRLGAIEPLDDDAEPDLLIPVELPSALVPASERFFAGGRTTHRAYQRDRLGIVGETLFAVDGELLEVGGDALLLLNLDYRFPISGPVGGTLFFDIGNVWADWRDVDLGEAKAGVGIGFRYRSPIGPVRLDVGWKLDPRDDERNPVFFLSFGNPF